MEGGGPQSSKQEKKGLRRIWKGIRHFFRHIPHRLTPKPAAPASATNSTPIPPASDLQAAHSPGEPTPGSPYPPIDKPPILEVDEMQENAPLPDGPLALPPGDSLSEYPHDQELRFYKAKAIFARYNIELTEADLVVRPKPQYAWDASTVAVLDVLAIHQEGTGRDPAESRRCRSNHNNYNKTQPTMLRGTASRVLVTNARLASNSALKHAPIVTTKYATDAFERL